MPKSSISHDENSCSKGANVYNIYADVCDSYFPAYVLVSPKVSSRDRQHRCPSICSLAIAFEPLLLIAKLSTSNTDIFSIELCPIETLESLTRSIVLDGDDGNFDL